MKVMKKACGKPDSPGWGFTLIELLVVIAIIAILATLLFPMLSKGVNGALTTKSMANLKQIHLLVENYVNGKDGIYPPARSSVTNSYSDTERYWSRLVWEYNFGAFQGDPPSVMDAMKNSNYSKVMWCPLLVKRYGQDQHPIGRTSYSLNWFFAVASDGGGVRWDGNAAMSGRMEPYIVAGTLHPANPKFGTYAYFQSSLYPYDQEHRNVAYEYGNSDSALALFLDGHARLIPRAEAVALNSMIADQTSLE